MTDTATTPAADSEAEPQSARPAESGQRGESAPAAEFASTPPEPRRRKKHLGWWIGVPAGAAVVALVASSLMLIAPGTSIAGVPVGFHTSGAAAEAVSAQLARTTIVLTGAGGGAEITAAELGATIDSRAAADSALSEYPLWNPTTWNSESASAPISIDEDTATEALREVAPTLYVDPTDATIAFDPATAAYTATPETPGVGVDFEQMRSALQSALVAGESTVELDVPTTEIPAATTTADAEQTVASLNGILDTAGFYVGTERTVPIDRAVAASWIAVTPAGDGSFTMSADAAAIQSAVDGLAPLVNRAAKDGVVITDSTGAVLRKDAVGSSGRELGDTSTVAGDFATQLSTGNGVFVLPVTEVAPVVKTVSRRIEVDLGEQRTYLYENEAPVQSWLISSGVSGHDTDVGNFRIYAKLPSQNMGNQDTTKAPFYYTKNVPSVMYYNGDEALHGAYWHHNFGSQMSHGCVNMPVDVAAYVYGWAPMGTEVWVHA